ncbi:hypothetical protein PO909_010525 [Leuciscus waleckii]
MAAMVATERHLWLNLADIGEKEKALLLDSPVSPTKLFGTSVEAVVGKFREAKARSAAFKTCIPLRSGPRPRQAGGPGPSWSEDHRQGQRSSVASRAPPPGRRRTQRRRASRKKRDLREVIQRKRSSAQRKRLRYQSWGWAYDENYVLVARRSNWLISLVPCIDLGVILRIKRAVVSERIGRVNIRADEKQNPVSPHLGLGRGVVEFPGDYEMQVCFDVVLDRP